MRLLSSLKNLVFPNAGMVCPRCEKPLDGHDEAACSRAMSRRYFFGVTLGAAAAVAGAAAMPQSGVAIMHEWRGHFISRMDMLYGLQPIHPEIGGWGDLVTDGWSSKILKRGDTFTIPVVYLRNPIGKEPNL